MNPNKGFLFIPSAFPYLLPVRSNMQILIWKLTLSEVTRVAPGEPMGSKLSVHLAKGWSRVDFISYIPATRGRGVVFEKPSSHGTFSPISGARSITDQIRLRGRVGEFPDTDQIIDGPARFFFSCISAVPRHFGGLNEGRSSRTLGEATRYRGR